MTLKLYNVKIIVNLLTITVKNWIDEDFVMAGGVNEKASNQSVAKLLQLITYLSESRLPMRLQDIAVSTNIPQVTCLRYLTALVQEGYVFQDEDSGRYSMTWGICHLGDQVRAHKSLRAISGDIVNGLSAALGQGICLVVEHEMECMYLDCIYDSFAMGGTLIRIGKQTPLYAASSGKVLLAEFSESELDRLIEQKGFISLTPKTISTKEQLLAEIEKVKELGYAIDDEECELGLRCVAVPICDYTGKAVAAVSSFGSVDVMTEKHMLQEVIPALQDAANKLSFRMGSGCMKR